MALRDDSIRGGGLKWWSRSSDDGMRRDVQSAGNVRNLRHNQMGYPNLPTFVDLKRFTCWDVANSDQIDQSGIAKQTKIRGHPSIC